MINEISRILFLWPDKNRFWPRIISKSDNRIDIDNAFYNKGLVYGAVRKFFAPRNMFLSRMLGSWIKNIDKYSCIIIQASLITSKIPDYLRKRGYKGRIIYWYWDPVSGSVSPYKVNRNICELWSFDKDDCERYEMKFNDTYHVFQEDNDNQDYNIKYDFTFIGKDKKRYNELIALKNYLNKLNYITNFYIVATKEYLINIKKEYSKPVQYRKIIEIVKQSKVIVDISQNGQSGLSQRCMEALFYNKKLLTNNKNINKYPFYNSDRVFIFNQIDEITEEQLSQFMKIKIEKDDDLIRFYSFENWINRFGE